MGFLSSLWGGIKTVGKAVLGGITGNAGNIIQGATSMGGALLDSKEIAKNREANVAMFNKGEANALRRQRAAERFSARSATTAFKRSQAAAVAAGNKDWQRQKEMLRLNARHEKRIDSRERRQALADYKTQLADQLRVDNSKVQRLSLDARRAGIHPLAALGVSSTFSAPTIPSFAGGVAGSANQQAVASASPASSPGFAGPGSPPYFDGGGGTGDAILSGIAAFNQARTNAADATLQEKQLEVMQSEIDRNKAMGAASVVDATSRTIASRARASALGATAGGQNLQASALGGVHPPGKGLNPPVMPANGGLAYPGFEVERNAFEISPATIGVELPNGLGTVHVPNEDALGDGLLGPGIAGAVGAKRQLQRSSKSLANPPTGGGGSYQAMQKIWDLAKWIHQL